RIVTFYERSLTTSVNDIEHIESQSIPNYGIIKIFFQPTVNINAALAQVSAMSQTVLKQMPAGITPPLILSFDASSVPILQLALSSDTLSETTLFDDASSFIRPQLASVAGAAIPLPYGGKVRQVQADLNQQALHTYGISANDVVNALSIQNLITPVGTQKIGTFEYTATRELLARRLRREGHQVVQPANGRAALERVAKENFDLILLDMMMPDLNGYEVLTRLKADGRFRHIPVIVISALDEIDSVVRCIEAGAEDYLSKP